jgi:hypothetical protein
MNLPKSVSHDQWLVARPPRARSGGHAAQEVTMSESARQRRRPMGSALWLPPLKNTSGREPS